MQKCILCIVELNVTVNSVKILEVLPRKLNTVFTVYRWATSRCQEHKTVEHCHRHANNGYPCTVVKLQKIAYCCH